MNKISGKNESKQELDTRTFGVCGKWFQVICKYKGCIWMKFRGFVDKCYVPYTVNSSLLPKCLQKNQN